jgi:protein-disulfide isomerase
MTTTLGRLAEPVTERDHVRGPWAAPVTIVEYGDYQCPYCRQAHPVVQQLLAERPATVRFAFRHFPLTNVHPYAEFGAQAAEAAGTRGRFWEMHDWLFDHQDELSPVALALAARALGLPSGDVQREVGDHAYLDRIRDDFVSGVRSGVNGTPTFFINGVRHDQGYALTDLLVAVDAAERRS